MKRRQFFKRLGEGVFVFFTFKDIPFLQEVPRQRMGQALPADFNAFLRIGADGRVSCFTGKIEMGQGVITSLAQMLADELDVPLDSVDMVMGDTDLCPWDMGTFGSLTTRSFGPSLRAAAAEARAVLLLLASERLKVPVEHLEVKEGIISDKTRSGVRVSYAELTKGKRIERFLEKKPKLKKVSEFRIMGKPFLRHDALEKVTGEAKFAGDIRLPGMLYARILRPPAYGAQLKSVDTSEAKKMSGIQVVEEGDFVAVLHEFPEAAAKALSKIQAEWEMPGPGVDDKTIYEHLLKVAPEGKIAAQGGNLQEGEKLASVVFDETYFNSYVAHAAVETHTALVSIENGKATVWASTQTPFSVKEEVARTLGFPSQNVHVITPFVGGGFGGKTRNLQAVEAARLAKRVGRPVQVAWTREEEFFYDTFRPAAVVKIKSGISESGEITFWDYVVYFAGERGSQQFYNIPHHCTVVRGEWMRGAGNAHPFSVGAWRAPAVNTNTFARESQIDIMAARAGMDPVEFRLKNLKNPRMERVLRAAAEKFGWKPIHLPSGKGYGVSLADYLGTYVAAIAEVEVDKNTGNIRVKRVVCAQDMGVVINPEGAKLQIEGCVMMGLGYALREEVHFKDGKILDLNFDTYEIPRFSWLPEIETVLVENNDLPPQGGGEPAIVNMGAVVANAVFDALGARVCALPITPGRLKIALQKINRKGTFLETSPLPLSFTP